MKQALIAAITALSLCFCATAMAKDVDAIDLFVGNFVGVGTMDFDKLVANKMVSDAINKGIASEDGLEGILEDFKAAGLDYKKDIDLVAFAVDEKGQACASLDSKVSLAQVVEKNAKKMEAKSSEYKGSTIYSDGSNSMALLSDKRLVVCEEGLDIKAILDNAKADKPKTLKDRDKAIFEAYNATSKSADIRAGAKMTKSLREQAKSLKLDDGQGKSIGVADAEAASFSLSFSKGLELVLSAKTSKDDVAKKGADLINAQLTGILSDPSLNEIGLGFVKDSVKIVSDKKNLVAKVTLTDEQLTMISSLLAGLDAAAPAKPAKAEKKAAAPAKAK